jgi:hypothetical protein
MAAVCDLGRQPLVGYPQALAMRGIAANALTKVQKLSSVGIRCRS